MTGNSVERKVTPGLGAAWKFWRNVEQQNLSGAEQSVSVLEQISGLDPETKITIDTALEELRKDGASRTAVLNAIVNVSQTPPTNKSHIKHRESSATEQVQALDSILEFLKQDDIDAALSRFSNLQYQSDRAKILASLISSKMPLTAMEVKIGHTPPADARRAGIATLYPSEARRAAVVKLFLKAYFEKLGQ